MSLSIDYSVQLVWAIANTEANFACDQNIRPVHFFLAILKFCDSRFPSQIKHIDLTEEARLNIASVGAQIRHYLEMPGDEVTKLRRSLRGTVRGDANAPTELVMLHRSDEARNIFKVAASKAASSDSPHITVLHILEALFETGNIDVENMKRAPSKPGSKGARWRMTTDSGKKQSSHNHEWPGRHLSLLVKAKELAPFVGREKEVKTLASILLRTSGRNALIVGEPGVGKTALIEGIALRVNQDDGLRKLKNAKFLEIGGAQIAAACSSAVDLEARLLSVLQLAQRTTNAVLCIDDLYGLTPKHLDLVSPLAVLVSGLAETGIPCIASTTPTHFEHLIKLSPSFCRRFETIILSPPSSDDLRRIGQEWMLRIADGQNVTFLPGVLDESIRLVDLLPAGRVMPDRLINLLDNLATFSRVTSLAASGSSKQRLDISPDNLRSVMLEHYGIQPSKLRQI